MILVLIADDHAILRQGLRQILADAEDMTVVGEAANGIEVMQMIRGDCRCDVVLLDIAMPGRNGIEVLKQIKDEKPNLPVLVLSMYPEDQYAVRLLKAGAAGYLTKESAPELLVQAIRKVAAGKKYISPSVAELLADQLDSGNGPQHASLSDREFQILLQIAAGKTVSEIAAALSLSVKTVSTYRARVLDKMQMKNNAELTHYAIKNQLVD
jgi:DNA-binding NarL/FixJ family response regulator